MKLLLIGILIFGTTYSGYHWGAYSYYKKTAKSGIDYNMQDSNDSLINNQNAKLVIQWKERYLLYLENENQWRIMFLINVVLGCFVLIYFNERRRSDERIQKLMND